METLRAHSGAKINLSLDILERLPNGYHTLRSVVHPIGLWDMVEFSFRSDERIVFECDHPDLCGDDNLCVRAFSAWRQAVGIALGADIRLLKNIPHGAGLGGGSGDAAATLLLAQSGGLGQLKEETLSALAATLGADVPFFLAGTPVLMEGIGEQLSPLPALIGWVVLLKPREGFSTPAIYRAWDEGELQSERATEGLLSVWPSNDIEEIGKRLGNDLERAARLVSPLPALCIEGLLEAGALGARLSGSGSACYGLFGSQERAEEARRRLEKRKAKDVLLESATTLLAPLCSRGVELLE